MKMIRVGICLGTTCFVMGASKLQDIEQHLKDEYRNRVEIVGLTCLGECNNSGEYVKAPYVKVDDELICEATIEKVIEAIERKL